ncbi:TPA: hypothetical protein NJ068_002547 [Vibrio parahaemolyticus]|uniref:hypothetical protein n=1 Tax=Vibrio parahaemolyticus TaxID=670 RepID=UPI00226AB13B|nr:hypothetical protein [Vibrio parahaemolyticus]MCX8925357.1 hypothetical protein [Vibrio parahaemolyticus]HCG6131698.1 hypothetical protein [Vibrio parahaemolyticus]HCG8183296.1 hypothetical protein [Vibrio parahaemolyticus]HCG9431068.1 hypothetical protein [Vibrio parahaemolyticus]HCG9628192.1 hypothetical protein [Vibrio parahaemolyticus]
MIDKPVLVVISDHDDATLDISFKRPLDVNKSYDVIYFPLMNIGKFYTDIDVLELINEIIETRVISSFCFCRCTTALSISILELAKSHSIKTVTFWDDNLLGIPESVGKAVHEYFNEPSRVRVMSTLINDVDLFLASTPNLEVEISQSHSPKNIQSLSCYRSLNFKEKELVSRKNHKKKKTNLFKIGYMGSQSHLNDLALVSSSLSNVLRRHENVVFEIFGTIDVPDEISDLIGTKVFKHGKCLNYESFVDKLCCLSWNLGLAPLENNKFNSFKADTKWVEYSIAGIPTFASKDSTYDRAIDNECVGVIDDDFEDTLTKLLDDDAILEKYLDNSRNFLFDKYNIEEHSRELIKFLTGL